MYTMKYLTLWIRIDFMLPVIKPRNTLRSIFFFWKVQIIVKVREEPWKQFLMFLVSVQVFLTVFTTKI